MSLRAFPDPMDHLFSLIADPAAWLALLTLVVMEVVLGVDNLVFVALVSNKLPPERRKKWEASGRNSKVLVKKLKV